MPYSYSYLTPPPEPHFSQTNALTKWSPPHIMDSNARPSSFDHLKYETEFQKLREVWHSTFSLLESAYINCKHLSVIKRKWSAIDILSVFYLILTVSLYIAESLLINLVPQSLCRFQTKKKMVVSFLVSANFEFYYVLKCALFLIKFHFFSGSYVMDLLLPSLFFTMLIAIMGSYMLRHRHGNIADPFCGYIYFSLLFESGLHILIHYVYVYAF